MKISLFPLDVVLFPGAPLPLHIFEERYRTMVRRCIAEEKVFGVVCASREGLAVVGCTARIVRTLQEYPDGRSDVLTEGVERFEIQHLDDSQAYLQADVRPFNDDGREAARDMRELCLAMHFEVLELAGAEVKHIGVDLNEPISFQVAWSIPAELAFKQELLSMRSDYDRTERLLSFYEAVLPKLRGGVQARAGAQKNGHRVM
jgi:Lon protease-like protein